MLKYDAEYIVSLLSDYYCKISAEMDKVNRCIHVGRRKKIYLPVIFKKLLNEY